MGKDKNKEEKPKKEDIADPFFIPEADDKKDQIGKTFQDTSKENTTLMQRLLKEIKIKNATKKGLLLFFLFPLFVNTAYADSQVVIHASNATVTSNGGTTVTMHNTTPAPCDPAHCTTITVQGQNTQPVTAVTTTTAPAREVTPSPSVKPQPVHHVIIPVYSPSPTVTPAPTITPTVTPIKKTPQKAMQEKPSILQNLTHFFQNIFHFFGRL